MCGGQGSQGWPGLLIKKQLEIFSSAGYFRVPPELACIICEDLDAGFLNSCYPLWDDAVHLRECAQSGFCGPSILHEQVVMLFERELGSHPDSQPPCRFLDESDETVSYIDIVIEIWPVVLLVASHGCEEWCFCLRSVKLEISPACPFDALRCAGFNFPDNLVHVLAGCHPAEVVYKGEAVGLESLLNSILEPSGVFAQRIGSAGEPCGAPASTEWLCKTLPLITISTVQSERKL